MKILFYRLLWLLTAMCDYFADSSKAMQMLEELSENEEF